MRACRAVSLLIVLVLGMACASRSQRTTASNKEHHARFRRLMDEAARAVAEGRPGEASRTYLAVAESSGVPAEAREAYLQAGLLRLRGDVAAVDVLEATRLLRECRTRFEGSAEPLALTATLAVLDRLERTERTAHLAVETASREGARRDEDARALRRTISALRQQLEKRDEALRKAAEAAVGPRPR